MGLDGAGDARDGLEVREELDVLEAGLGEQGGEGGGLGVADFKSNETAGGEGAEGGGDEAAVDFEAIGIGAGVSKKGDGGLVVADFDGERGAIGSGDVGRVGGDDVELLVGDGSEEVAVEKADGNHVAGCVVRGEGEGGGGDVNSGDGGVGQLVGEGNSDGAGACADVKNARGGEAGGLAFGPVDDFFDEVLGFGAGDEDGGGDVEGDAVKLGFAEDVLDGFASEAAADEGTELRGVVGRMIPMGDEPGSVSLGMVLLEEMQQQGLRVESSALREWTFCEDILPFGNEAANLGLAREAGFMGLRLRRPGWSRTSTARPGSG